MSNFFVLIGLVLVLVAVGLLTNSIAWPMLLAGLVFVWIGFMLSRRRTSAATPDGE